MAQKSLAQKAETRERRPERREKEKLEHGKEVGSVGKVRTVERARRGLHVVMENGLAVPAKRVNRTAILGERYEFVHAGNATNASIGEGKEELEERNKNERPPSEVAAFLVQALRSYGHETYQIRDRDSEMAEDPRELIQRSLGNQVDISSEEDVFFVARGGLNLIEKKIRSLENEHFTEDVEVRLPPIDHLRDTGVGFTVEFTYSIKGVEQKEKVLFIAADEVPAGSEEVAEVPEIGYSTDVEDPQLSEIESHGGDDNDEGEGDEEDEGQDEDSEWGLASANETDNGKEDEDIVTHKPTGKKAAENVEFGSVKSKNVPAASQETVGKKEVRPAASKLDAAMAAGVVGNDLARAERQARSEDGKVINLATVRKELLARRSGGSDPDSQLHEIDDTALLKLEEALSSGVNYPQIKEDFGDRKAA